MINIKDWKMNGGGQRSVEYVRLTRNVPQTLYYFLNSPSELSFPAYKLLTAGRQPQFPRD